MYNLNILFNLSGNVETIIKRISDINRMYGQGQNSCINTKLWLLFTYSTSLREWADSVAYAVEKMKK